MRLGDSLSHWARVAPERVAASFLETGIKVTYGALNRQAWQIANALVSHGVRAGERIAALTDNEPETLAIYHGAARAGAVVVPISSRLVGQEVANIIEQAGPRGVIVSQRHQKAIAGIDGDLSFVWVIGEPDHTFTPLSRVLQRSPAQPLVQAAGDDAPLFELYTSGTTGQPKGVVTTHRAWIASLWAQAFARNANRNMVFLHTLPLGHVGGTNWLLVPTFAGGTVAVLPGFRPNQVLDAIDHSGVTEIVVVPTMLRMLLDDASLSTRRLASLRRIGYGGAYMHEQLADQARLTLSCELLQAYGLSEIAGGLAAVFPAGVVDPNDTVAYQRVRTSVGRAILGVEIAIVDERGKALPPGQTGEIAIRSDIVMAGYARHPKETAEAIRDGWLHTGDIGRLDEEHYLFLSDRKRDMIITGGLNVYSQEVESVLHELEGVSQAYVIGAPDPVWGERIVACIVANQGATLDETAILDACEGRLAGYKKPRTVYFVDDADLPRSALGKVKKRQLLEIIALRREADSPSD